MINVGITGGIGSGKSTVCKIFETLKIPVYYADWHARILSNTHPDVVSGVTKLLGDSIYQSGKMDRKKVGEIVFNDKEKLNALNQIIHPVVAEHFEEWKEKHSDYPYILKEAAILFESGAYKQVDQIITVVAPVDLRIDRVVKRDGISREDVLSRINNQMKDEDKVKQSDYVIYCNDIDLVITQVLKIHHSLINKD